EDLCAHINKLCAGKLEITPFAAGAVTGVFETLDSVSAGVLQGHSSWAGYFSGKDPGLAVISDFVFGYQHPWQAEAWYYQKGGLDMLREAYAKYNAYPVGVSWWGVESIVSKKPIKSMADFKGVKFRSPQGMTAEILTKLGASIVVLPGGEVYSALDKGVVDAADWATISMNQRMGFHEVAKNPLIIDHSMPVQEFTVNLATWKALPDDVKLLVSSAVREWTWDQVQRVAVDDVRVLKELKAKGVERIRWDEAEMRKVRELAHKTWEDWSKKGPLAKRAYDSQVAWLRDLGLIA
ncbi:MAG TPA: TRAP transporter substrate-binding protein, partial [Caldimonas sp.]